MAAQAPASLCMHGDDGPSLPTARPAAPLQGQPCTRLSPDQSSLRFAPQPGAQQPNRRRNSPQRPSAPQRTLGDHQLRLLGAGMIPLVPPLCAVFHLIPQPRPRRVDLRLGWCVQGARWSGLRPGRWSNSWAPSGCTQRPAGSAWFCRRTAERQVEVWCRQPAEGRQRVSLPKQGCRPPACLHTLPEHRTCTVGPMGSASPPPPLPLSAPKSGMASGLKNGPVTFMVLHRGGNGGSHHQQAARPPALRVPRPSAPRRQRRSGGGREPRWRSFCRSRAPDADAVGHQRLVGVGLLPGDPGLLKHAHRSKPGGTAAKGAREG